MYIFSHSIQFLLLHALAVHNDIVPRIIPLLSLEHKLSKKANVVIVKKCCLTAAPAVEEFPEIIILYGISITIILNPSNSEATFI